jgi:mannose-1-phosphate guanylyltransferase
MRIAVDTTKQWQRRGPDLVCGEIVVQSMAGRWSTASGASFATSSGWLLECYESCDTATAILAATLVIDDEAASLVACCPVEHIDAARAAFEELLRDARPEWPDTLILGDLLALPDVET